MIPVFCPALPPSMEFPVIAGGSFTDGGMSASSNFSVNLPIGVSAGDFLLVIIANSDAVASTNTPSGWSALVTGNHNPCVYYKIAAGGETTMIGTFTGSITFCAIAYRILGASSTTTPAISTIASGTSTTPDSPNLAPAYGTKNTLWISSCVIAVSGQVPGTNPTNYNLGGIGGSSVGTASMGAAGRALKAASEDPGAFTIAGSNDWIAYTIAVPPV
jgi:hypothetical protein